MDSITQIALGAAVGEAFLGKKVGYRAAAWGAALGTFPDLDILINPFVDGVIELRSHRSFTHSFTFVLLCSPIFGWMINKFHSSLQAGWLAWTKLTFLVFLTHILIDLPTVYGTQIFFPFTNTPYALDFIFIIDPLYTFPLLIGLIVSLIYKRSSKYQSLPNLIGLSLSTLYLIWGFGIKAHINSVFSANFENQYGFYEKIKTVPNGPTTTFWNGYLIKNDSVYVSTYSIFDDSTDLEFKVIPRNSHLIENRIEERAIETLLWFAQGYYSVQIEDESLMFYDLRFGRDDFWLSDDGNYIWKNEVLLNDEGEAYTFNQSIPSFNTRSKNISRYWNRIKGQ